MKNIIHIALKDIRQTLRDKMTFMFLLIMPILFTLLFGFAFGGLGGGSNGEQDTRLAVGVLDQDQSSSSAALKELLQGSQAIRLITAEGAQADLEKQVADKKLAASVVVPSGYGAAIAAGAPKQLIVSLDANSSSGAVAQVEIQAAANRMASSAVSARVIQQKTGGTFDNALSQTASAWNKPPIRLSVTSAEIAKKGSSSEGLMSVTHTAPGMMIQFAIAGLITAAQVLVGERKSRCMQRLLTTAVARHEILLGHFLAIFATIFVQFILLIAFGQIALKLDYLRQPLATLIMMLVTALFIAALGMLIGALAKTDDQAVIFSLVPMFVFAGLGGAWVPLDITGQAFQIIGHLSPVAWALDGFKNIIARGLDINAVWLPAGALIGYAALFFGLAVWKFKFE